MSSVQLQDAMDGWDPAPLSGLTDEEFIFLSERTRASRAQVTTDIDDAVRQALDHVPRLLRRPIKKLLGV